jgi:hypothetical protein
MNGNVAFVMKDIVILAASVYLLRQDALRVLRPSERSKEDHHRAGFDSANAIRTRD